MANLKAIATLAVGDRYLAAWKRHCEPNWQVYADKFGFDIVCLDKPLDTSERATSRSLPWQKCLILSQPFAERYERVLWLDSDILINNRIAADITADVPVDFVGAVEDLAFSQAEPVTAKRLLERIYEYWPNASVINYTPEEYYTNYGLPNGCDRVANTGVLLLSPAHHRNVLEHVYHTYEEKPGREWHMEMRPLSYELVKTGKVKWLDPRFNLMWSPQQFLYYPFLLQPRVRRDPVSLAKRKISKLVGLGPLQTLRKASVRAAFEQSFFFHLGGFGTNDMAMVSDHAENWWDFSV